MKLLANWLVLAMAGPALAQAPPDPAPEGPVPEVSAPPLVSAPSAPEPPLAADAPLLEPGPLAPPTRWAPAPAVRAPSVESPGRAPRIGLGLLLGAGAGGALGLVGGLLGSGAGDPAGLPVSPAWMGASAAFAVGAPLGVLLAGWLLGGEGRWWATVLGDLAGLALGAGAVLLGGPAGTPLLFALPLAGSVLGSELSSPASRAPAAPASGGPG